jgi:hypothetical protein
MVSGPKNSKNNELAQKIVFRPNQLGTGQNLTW